jgi:hypothetical protein
LGGTASSQWVKSDTTFSSASALTITVDKDINMIPVVNKRSDETYPTDWCNYDAAQWCNAVTLRNDKTHGSYNADGMRLTDGTGTYTPLDYFRTLALIGTEIPEDDILGYWVYIPRYAYEVQRLAPWNKPLTSQTQFDIRFESATTPKKEPYLGTNPSCTTAPVSIDGGTDYRTGCGVSRDYPIAAPYNESTWATHPAFTFGTTELNGFWVGKFEVTGSVLEPTIKPNLKSQVNQNIGVQWDIALSFTGKNDTTIVGGNGTTVTNNAHNFASTALQSHQLKNSEWGAVAYLSTSIYGVYNSNSQQVLNNLTDANQKVYNNSNNITSITDGNGNSGYGITGCGPTGTITTPSDIAYSGDTNCIDGDTDSSYSTPLGQLASTTGTIYGVYDMAGGASEFVMGNRTTNSSATTSSAINLTTAITTLKYIDLYKTSAAGGMFGTKPSWASSSTEYWYNFDVCSFTTCGGQANYETTIAQSISNNIRSWHGDYSNFVYASNPWFRRGGIAFDVGLAGLFSSLSNTGSGLYPYGFRSALNTF